MSEIAKISFYIKLLYILLPIINLKNEITQNYLHRHSTLVAFDIKNANGINGAVEQKVNKFFVRIGNDVK